MIPQVRQLCRGQEAKQKESGFLVPYDMNKPHPSLASRVVGRVSVAPSGELPPHLVQQEPPPRLLHRKPPKHLQRGPLPQSSQLWRQQTSHGKAHAEHYKKGTTTWEPCVIQWPLFEALLGHRGCPQRSLKESIDIKLQLQDSEQALVS